MKSSTVVSLLVLALVACSSFEPVKKSDMEHFKTLVKKDKQYSQICDLYYTVELAKQLNVAVPKMVGARVRAFLTV